MFRFGLDETDLAPDEFGDSGNTNNGGYNDADNAEKESLQNRFEEVKVIDEIDENLGFHRYTEGPEKLGWMVNMHPVRRHFWALSDRTCATSVYPNIPSFAFFFLCFIFKSFNFESRLYCLIKTGPVESLEWISISSKKTAQRSKLPFCTNPIFSSFARYCVFSFFFFCLMHCFYLSTHFLTCSLPFLSIIAKHRK
jgi:hypothetical protein